MLPLNNFLFDKKYVFESNRTKHNRKKKTIYVLIVLIVVIYLTLLSSIIFSGREENQKTKDTFYRSSPDLIAVFTGAAGRIKAAINLSKVYSQQKIFISGLFSKTTINYLSKIQKLPNDTNLNFIEADRWAKNTVENIISTKRFLKKHPTIISVIIVSHDYHLLRIKLLLKTIIKNKNKKFYFVGLKSNYFELKNIIILHKEVLKLIKSIFIILFW